VGKVEFDRSAGQHDQGERGLRGVEAVGPADDEPDVVVQSFRSPVVDLQSDGGEDPVTELADGLGDLDERREPGAAGFGAPAVEQFGGLLGVQVASEDGAERFFEAVAAPELTAAAAQLAQGRRLLVGEVFGAFEQRPAGAFELLGRALVGQLPQLVPGVAPNLIERVAGPGDDVERIMPTSA
jgi:hypothetical protein